MTNPDIYAAARAVIDAFGGDTPDFLRPVMIDLETALEARPTVSAEISPSPAVAGTARILEAAGFKAEIAFGGEGALPVVSFEMPAPAPALREAAEGALELLREALTVHIYDPDQDHIPAVGQGSPYVDGIDALERALAAPRIDPDYATALTSLRAIIEASPEEQPEEEDYDDTESAYNNGHDVGTWHAALNAQVAMEALLRLYAPTEAKLPRVVVTLDGGLVNGIVSDQPVETFVVDYDVDGADACDIRQIPQPDGATSDAVGYVNGKAHVDAGWVDAVIVELAGTDQCFPGWSHADQREAMAHGWLLDEFSDGMLQISADDDQAVFTGDDRNRHAQDHVQLAINETEPGARGGFTPYAKLCARALDVVSRSVALAGEGDE